MPRLSNLFHSSDGEKETLHTRIVPNRDQRNEQTERWRDLRDYLITDLERKSDCTVTSWLQGSYKLGTQIRPIRKGGKFDIDLGIYFEWSSVTENNLFTATSLKRMVQESLVEYADNVEEVIEVEQPAKERCSRISFTGDFHIDIPCYHLNSESEQRLLATESNGWEASDPVAFYEWFQENFETDESSEVRRQIRYFKIWSGLKLQNLEQKPSSILITVLVAEAYLTETDSRLSGDDCAFRNLCEDVANRLENSYFVANPVNKKENLNKLSSTDNSALVKALRELVRLSDRAMDTESIIDAVAIWGDVFEQFFPVPEEALETLQGTNLPAVQIFTPRVSVKAIEANGSTTHVGMNEIGPIPRNCKILFTIENTHELPADYRVSWTVRNKGKEAEYHNDLGHVTSKNTALFSNEHSLYKGTHYMDLLITGRLGEVIAFQRMPVVIEGGTFIPSRNPRKPSWSKFR